ncbi:MAG TPA: diguanylate cyclase [bacterium]|nr:diguanylate cyclase [bacterium]
MTPRRRTRVEAEDHLAKDHFTPAGLGPGLRLGARPARILVTDDTFANNGMLERSLEALGAIVTLGREIPTAAIIRSHNPDLIVLGEVHDDGRPGIVQDLQKDPRTHAIPIFVLGASDDAAQCIRILEDGAQDYLARPVSIEELIARIRVALRIKQREDALRRRLSFLDQLSRSDPLTTLLNRRAFEDRLYFEMERAKTSGEPLSCVMCDLDWFKDINDRYGHQVGDDVLQQVARTLVYLKRTQDAVCRYGGEEFVWLLPGADRATATDLAESLRTTIADVEIPTGTASFRITISIGVSTYAVSDYGMVPAGLLVEQADRALLQAKEQGKNRVAFREPLLFEEIES